MADFDVGGMLGLDASEFVDGSEEAGDAMEDVSGQAEDTADSLFEIDAAGMAAGGAMAGIGTAAQGALDDTQSMRETLGRTAVTTEMTRDETTELAKDLQNATFPMDDATATMDSLASQGVTTRDELEETANAADLVADATGTSAEAVADSAVPAIKAMGGEASDLNEHMDTFTYVARNTNMSVEDFSRVVTKMGPELQEMGLSVDETAQYIAALEEKGLDSRTAMREFRQSAREAGGDQEKLKEELDLTNEELGAQEQALQDAEGTTREHADAANESLSRMDELRAGFEEAKLAASEAIGPIDAMAPAMQTAGIMAMTLSTINFSAVIPSLVGVASAAAPVVLPLLAIAAAAGILYVAWNENIFGIRDIAKNVFGEIMDIADTVKEAFPNSIEAAVERVLDLFTWLKMKLVGSSVVPEMLADIISVVTDFDLKGAFEEAVDLATKVFIDWNPSVIIARKAAAMLRALPSWRDFKARGRSLIQGLINGITSKMRALRDTASGVADTVRSYLPGSDAEQGPLSDLTDAGKALPETMATGMRQNRGALESAGSRVASSAAPGGGRGDIVIERRYDGNAAMAAIFDVFEDNVDTRIQRREKSQKRRAERLGVRR